MSDEERVERRDEERDEELEEKKEQLEEEIEDFEEEYEELMENIEEAEEGIDEIVEEISECNEEIQELEEEKQEAESELTNRKLENKINRLREKRERLLEKLERKEEHRKDLKKKAKAAEERRESAKEKYVRMNISLPSEMKEDWKDLADDINTSVSEVIRSAVGAVGPILRNLKNLKDLEKLGDSLDKWGENLEQEIKRSGIEDIGKELEVHFEKEGRTSKPTDSSKVTTHRKRSAEDMERIRKRIHGLIKLQKALPITKLAQVLSIPEEKAENLIYELAAEGIEGQLEAGVFKFTNPSEEVIEKIYELIEKV